MAASCSRPKGLRTEKPRLFRSWAQIVEAFVAGQVNVIHLLSPATLWVRYGTRFPAKVVAWNHVNGSALTVAPGINSVADLGGKTVAMPVLVFDPQRDPAAAPAGQRAGAGDAPGTASRPTRSTWW
jgi:hypothetical protein